MDQINLKLQKEITGKEVSRFLKQHVLQIFYET